MIGLNLGQKPAYIILDQLIALEEILSKNRVFYFGAYECMHKQKWPEHPKIFMPQFW